jgi:antagonist of KipI
VVSSSATSIHCPLPVAARLANLLVGNDEGAAVLELNLLGPEIEFATDTLVALGGATFGGFESWRPVAVRAGQRIKFGAALNGCRGYLAVAGGIAVDRVLGSRSTYVRAGLGGWQGRALRVGDVLPLAAVSRSVAEHWWIDPRILPAYSAAPTVRVVPGAHATEFGREWLEREFKVTPVSDRMGLRLSGVALMRTGGGELMSSPVAPGTVQVPPDGQPIVLMADAQTIGGYPRLAHVIEVDLPLLAQLRPGDRVRFHAVPLEEAHQLWLAREHVLAMLRQGLAQKFR